MYLRIHSWNFHTNAPKISLSCRYWTSKYFKSNCLEMEWTLLRVSQRWSLLFWVLEANWKCVWKTIKTLRIRSSYLSSNLLRWVDWCLDIPQLEPKRKWLNHSRNLRWNQIKMYIVYRISKEWALKFFRIRRWKLKRLIRWTR